MESPLSLNPQNIPSYSVPSMSLSTVDTSRQMFKPTHVVDHRVPAEIVKKISYDGRTEYLVRWAGLPNSCNTWECPSKTPSIAPLVYALENPAAAAAAAFAASSGSAVGADSCTPGSSKAASTSTYEGRITPASSIGNESIGADFAGLDMSGNAAVKALVCMTNSARTSPAEFNPQVPPVADWSALLLGSTHPNQANAIKKANKPPRHNTAALGPDGKPKPRRRANSHGSSLHDIGTRIVITSEKGEHDGAKGYVSRVPVHPSTWYEVTLNDANGTVLKLRSSSFRVIADGASTTSPEKRPLEQDVSTADVEPSAPAATVATSSKGVPTAPQNKKPRTPKAALPELGQQVIITGDKGGRQGQRGSISRTPDHPSTWYELTLQDGEVLKLRSTSFTTNLDWTVDDDAGSSLVDGLPSTTTATGMTSVNIAAAPAPVVAAPQQPPAAVKAVNHIYQRLKDEDAMSDSEHG